TAHSMNPASNSNSVSSETLDETLESTWACKTAAPGGSLAQGVWKSARRLATLEADGTIRLLGRGSNCINTVGEKVFPEEVEEALRSPPATEAGLRVCSAMPPGGAEPPPR